MRIDNSVNQDEIYVSKSYANILNKYNDVLEKYKKSNQGKLISPAVEGQMMSMTQLFTGHLGFHHFTRPIYVSPDFLVNRIKSTFV